MGVLYANIQVADLDGLRSQEMEALVDTGAVTTVVPASFLRQIGVEPTERRPFIYASGEEVELDMAQVRIRVEDRETITWVIFGEDAGGAMLGAYTLEGVFLAVDPYNKRLVPVVGVLK